MKRAMVVALATAAVISSAAALGIGATAVPTDNLILTRTQYEGALRTLEQGREAVMLGCDVHGGFDREVCRAEVAGVEMIRVAELEARYRRSPQAQRAAQRARIDARYLVDRARCGAFNGVRRERCLVQAHATKGRALLEAAAPYEVRF